jgi:hypothetical protein
MPLGFPSFPKSTADRLPSDPNHPYYRTHPYPYRQSTASQQVQQQQNPPQYQDSPRQSEDQKLPVYEPYRDQDWKDEKK